MKVGRQKDIWTHLTIRQVSDNAIAPSYLMTRLLKLELELFQNGRSQLRFECLNRDSSSLQFANFVPINR